MPRINLLPWREEQRQERQRNFLATLGASVICAVGIIFYAGYDIEGRIELQNARNKKIADAIKKLEEDIKKVKSLQSELAALLARMDIIKRLQSSCPEIVHVFDEIPRLLPEGVYLTSLTQKDRTITIEGSAQSNARVATLMQNINLSQWLTEATLVVVQTQMIKATTGNQPVKDDSSGKFSKFTLQMKQKNPHDESEDTANQNKGKASTAKNSKAAPKNAPPKKKEAK